MLSATVQILFYSNTILDRVLINHDQFDDFAVCYKRIHYHWLHIVSHNQPPTSVGEGWLRKTRLGYIDHDLAHYATLTWYRVADVTSVLPTIIIIIQLTTHMTIPYKYKYKLDGSEVATYRRYYSSL